MTIQRLFCHKCGNFRWHDNDLCLVCEDGEWNKKIAGLFQQPVVPPKQEDEWSKNASTLTSGGDIYGFSAKLVHVHRSTNWGGRMKVTLNTLTSITKVILVCCDNRFGIHKNVYIRYCILIGSHLDSLFLDDPNEDTILGILKGCDSNVVQEALTAPCPWCQARTSYPPLPS